MDALQQMERRSFLRLAGIGVALLGVTPLWLGGCAVPEGVTDQTELAYLINEYRKQNHLPEIPISWRLGLVATLHAADLNTYQPHVACGGQANLHSWSSHTRWDGQWKACCYPGDHSNAPCMWEKPKEIAGYSGAGYEIAYFGSGNGTPQSALASWKQSVLHNDVILNKAVWQPHPWKALGAACAGNYACAWFGEVQE
jgi:hypothetical protein